MVKIGGEYLIHVVSAVVAGTLAELLPPDGEEGSGRMLKLLVSLLILCVIALPLLELLSGAPDALLGQIEDYFDALEEDGQTVYDEYAAQTMEYIRAESADQAEIELAALLASHFDISRENIQVEITLSSGEEGISLKKVTVLLSGSAVFADPYAIEEYLAVLFGSETECAAVLA